MSHLILFLPKNNSIKLFSSAKIAKFHNPYDIYWIWQHWMVWSKYNTCFIFHPCRNPKKTPLDVPEVNHSQHVNHMICSHSCYPNSVINHNWTPVMFVKRRWFLSHKGEFIDVRENRITLDNTTWKDQMEHVSTLSSF